MIEIGINEIHLRDRARLAAFRLPRIVGDDRLHLPLVALGELLAFAGEHLNAVVLERIVRRRDDDAGVVPLRAGEIRDRRRGHDAGARDCGAFTRRPVRELGLDPRARFTRVAADEDPRPRRRGRCGVVRAPRPYERRAEDAHRGRIERIAAGLAANTIGTEQARNRFNVWHW